MQDKPAYGGRRTTIHSLVRLREKQRTELPMVIDTLRVAFGPLSSAPLNHTGRRLPERRDRSVRVELHSGRNHWRIRPGLAADRSDLVCTADDVAANKIMII